MKVVHKSVFDMANFARNLSISISILLWLSLLLTSSLQPIIAESIDEEPTCKIDQTDSDCIDTTPDATTPEAFASYTRDLSEQLLTLTDENFEELTWTSTPSTWLIMFKTDACGICKKAMPEFEKLPLDPILTAHNENQLKALARKELQYVKGKELAEDEIPSGPVYVATIDANWEGRDTTKRFAIDATPTIIVLRNEGYDDDMDDTRTYTTYRGQRAKHPLRNYVLGGFRYRSKSTIPPPLSTDERKPNSLFGRYLEIGKPYMAWVGKLLAAWFIFISILGLFMRVHNYAWNDEDVSDQKSNKSKEIEREIAQGKKEYKVNLPKETEERHRKMLQRKLENRAKFAAKKKEEKKKIKPIDGEMDDEEDFVAVGVAIKKSDIQNGTTAGKSKRI